MFLYSGLENQFNNVIIVTFPAVFVLIFFVINIKHFLKLIRGPISQLYRDKSSYARNNKKFII